MCRQLVLMRTAMNASTVNGSLCCEGCIMHMMCGASSSSACTGRH
jgi:hypothetical protein